MDTGPTVVNTLRDDLTPATPVIQFREIPIEQLNKLLFSPTNNELDDAQARKARAREDQAREARYRDRAKVQAQAAQALAHVEVQALAEAQAQARAKVQARAEAQARDTPGFVPL